MCRYRMTWVQIYLVSYIRRHSSSSDFRVQTPCTSVTTARCATPQRVRCSCGRVAALAFSPSCWSVLPSSHVELRTVDDCSLQGTQGPRFESGQVSISSKTTPNDRISFTLSSHVTAPRLLGVSFLRRESPFQERSKR